MTEHRILKLLIGDNVNTNYSFDYPKLQKKSVNIIAQNVTDIIYESLKQKSSASNIKRGNLLKFLNKLCETTEPHMNDSTNICFLSTLYNSFKTDENEEVENLIEEINKELEFVVPVNTVDKIIQFYKYKNRKQKDRNRQLEEIKKNDQKKLDCKFNLQARKNILYYEIDENFINDTLGNSLINNNSGKTIRYNEEYREKQIKLAYALINLNNNENCLILERILKKLTKSNSLRLYEKNFLMYFWTEYAVKNCDYDNIFLNHFFFIIEKVVIRYGQKLLGFEDQEMCNRFFVDMEGDSMVLKIKSISRRQPRMHFKLTSLIYELYYFSYCNDKILKFCNVLL